MASKQIGKAHFILYFFVLLSTNAKQLQPIVSSSAIPTVEALGIMDQILKLSPQAI